MITKWSYRPKYTMTHFSTFGLYIGQYFRLFVFKTRWYYHLIAKLQFSIYFVFVYHDLHSDIVL